MRPSISASSALAALLALLVLAACGDKKEQPPPAPPPPKPVSGLAAIPADATAVVRLDLRALARSELAAEITARVLEADPALAGRVRSLLAACSIDVARDLDAILLATGSASSQALMVVEGDIDAQRLAACVGEAVGLSGGSVVVSAEAPRTVWETRGSDGSPSVWFAFGAPRTLVVSVSEAWLAAALGEGGKLATDARQQAVLQRADQGAPVWGVGTVGPGLGQRFSKLTDGAVGAPIQYVFGHLRLSDGLEAELAAVMASAADAGGTADFARAQLEIVAMLAQGVGLGGLVSRIRVELEKDTVFLRLTLPAQDLKEVLSQIDRAAGGE